MSETSVESTRSSGGGGGFFTRKIGPLPVWGWVAIIGGILLLYAYKQKSSASTAAASTSQAAGGVDSSLVPQFINQTYDNSTPPPAPNVTVNNTLPPEPITVNNNIPTPPTMTPPNPKQPAPRPAPITSPIFNGTYAVKKGQTLQEVANQFGITREQLAHANGLGTGAGLRTGQVLHVPKPAPGGTPNKAI
jgi:LysM repeat protein